MRSVCRKFTEKRSAFKNKAWKGVGIRWRKRLDCDAVAPVVQQIPQGMGFWSWDLRQGGQDSVATCPTVRSLDAGHSQGRALGLGPGGSSQSSAIRGYHSALPRQDPGASVLEVGSGKHITVTLTCRESCSRSAMGFASLDLSFFSHRGEAVCLWKWTRYYLRNSLPLKIILFSVNFMNELLWMKHDGVEDN